MIVLETESCLVSSFIYIFVSICCPLTLGKRTKEEASEVKCFVWSVVLYGADTWALRRSEQKQLEAFQTRIWRRMEHVKWTDKIKNAVVLEIVGE